MANAVLVEEKHHQQTAAFGKIHFQLHDRVGDVFAGELVTEGHCFEVVNDLDK